MKHAAVTRSIDRPALLALAVLALFWGYNWVVMKVALHYAAPFDFAALRSSLASLFLLAIPFYMGKSLRPPNLRATLLLGALQTTGFVTLVTWSLVHGGAGRSAVLVYTMPFWVILLAHPFLGERIRGIQWLAVILAFCGLIFILAPWEHADSSLISNLLALLAGLSWALSVLVVKRIPVNSSWELLTLTGWQMLLGSLPLILLAWLVPAPPIHWNLTFVLALLYNIVPANGLAWLLWLYILQRLPANISGLSALIVPVVGVLTAWLQLGETPGFAEAAGMVLVLGSLGILTMNRKTA